MLSVFFGSHSIMLSFTRVGLTYGCKTIVVFSFLWPAETLLVTVEEHTEFMDGQQRSGFCCRIFVIKYTVDI